MSTEESGILEQPLIRGLREALAQPHPLDLMLFASGLVSVLELDPLADLKGGQPSAVAGISLTELIESFLDVGLRETEALLLVLARLTEDELLARRIRSEVASRKRPVPGWLIRLDEVAVTRTVFMTHVLGDGDDLILGIDLPGGRHLTVLVYVDHNMGTLVKDAFAIDAPVDEVVARLQELSEGDGEFTELSPSDARAHVSDAVAAGRRTLDAPHHRDLARVSPLLEWLLRLLPPGGTGYVIAETAPEQIEALARNFIASGDLERRSSRGREDDDAVDLDIAETLLRFGANYGTGDPLRLSPVSVEVILLDLIPRKITADTAYLERMPDVLRALVPFAHRARAVPARYTTETLAAIDELEPEFRQLIREPRSDGAKGMLERLGFSSFDDDAELADGEFFLRFLAREVGSVDALNDLDASPLPSEQLELAGVADDVHASVREVGRLVTDVCARLFDDEFRTVCVRLLARTAQADAAIFRRGKPQTAAAALSWIALKLNDGTHEVKVGDVMTAVGLTGSPAQRARPMLVALGADHPEDWSYDPVLGDPELLTSGKRAALIERRNALAQLMRSGDGDAM